MSYKQGKSSKEEYRKEVMKEGKSQWSGDELCYLKQKGRKDTTRKK